MPHNHSFADEVPQLPIAFPVKLFEVRDRGTFMPMIAVLLQFDPASPTAAADKFLLRRAGYGEDQIHEDLRRISGAEPYVLFSKLDGVQAHYDPFAWGITTMRDAHLHIIANWNTLKSGDVIDVEFIRGKSTTPKISERLS